MVKFHQCHNDSKFLYNNAEMHLTYFVNHQRCKIIVDFELNLRFRDRQASNNFNSDFLCEIISA